MSGASQLLAESDPQLAIALNPFNADARVNAAVAVLDSGDDALLAEAAAGVRTMLGFSPGDARGYSLLGAIFERNGEAAAAETLYRLALDHSKTEIHALLMLADSRLRQNDIAAAMGFIDLIVRRWPEYWDRVAPVLTAAAATSEGRSALRVQLHQLPPWRGRAIRQLVRDRNGLLFARDLMMEAPDAARGRPEWPGEVDAVVTALAAAKGYGEAHMLFLAALTPEQAPLAGYVFDPTFTRAAGGGYFGWRAARGGAAEIRLPAASEGALRLVFREAPVRPGLVTQNLRLPPGHYRMEAEVEGINVELPKRLFWQLSCPDLRQVLTEIVAPAGTYAARTIAMEFEVPAVTCPVQRLSLDTDVRTDSWRDRYRGEVQFLALRINRL